MPRMGRPRERNKDLPPGLYQKPNKSWYYFGPPMQIIAGKKRRTYREFGALDRAAAIEAYHEFKKETASGEPGTLGEIIDAYQTHRFGLARVPAQATRDEYKRQLPIIRDLWGDRKFAPTADDVGRRRGVYLTTRILDDYLRDHEGKRGEVSANRLVRLVSSLFRFAISREFTTYNPANGVIFNPEHPRKTVADRDALKLAIEAANPPMRLMLELASVSSISQGDIRLMTKAQVGELLDTKRSKTGVEQEWESTEYSRSIFERAKALPGYPKSVCVFPRDDGQPFTLKQFQAAFRHAKKKAKVQFQFRDIRKWNIRQAKADGQDPQDFAAHKDRRTTERHYLNDKKRAKFLR